MKFPIKVASNTLGGSFSGFDTFSTAAVDTRRNLIYRPSFYEIPVTIAMTELSVNSSPEKVLDLMRIEFQSSAQDAADDLGTQFYSTGTGKNFNGLELLVDDGTNNTSIGGLTRADFTPNLDSTVTAAASNNLSLAQMDTLFSNVRSGSVEPTAYYTTETVADLFRQLLTPQERIMKTNDNMRDGLIGGTGFTSLAHMGKPIFADEKATSGVLYLVNENFLEFYGLEAPSQYAGAAPVQFKSTDIEGNDYSNVMGLGFNWTGWIRAINSWTMTGHIIFGGQFVQRNPKRSGKLTGITGV